MNFDIFYQLFLGTFLGALIGLEREIKKREAGLQTYTLVTLGACLFSLIAFSLANQKIIDPSLIIMAIAVGVSFIGGGAIFHKENQTQGLTTAAGLWTSAAIGLAVGAKFYFLATIATLLTILILAGFGELEEKIFRK